MSEDDKPVTRAELKSILKEELSGLVTKAELKTELKELRAGVKEELSELQSAMSEQMRDIETALLRAFQNYAQGVAAQIQKLTASDSATEIRMAALENRVLELETRRSR
jgi:two-component sensor histidine kinase